MEPVSGLGEVAHDKAQTEKGNFIDAWSTQGSQPLGPTTGNPLVVQRPTMGNLMDLWPPQGNQPLGLTMGNPVIIEHGATMSMTTKDMTILCSHERGESENAWGSGEEPG